MESDLARLRGVKTASEFVGILEQVCETVLTNDYWTITLPSGLATSASQSPTLFAYYASLALLNARALYSSQSVTDLVDPSVHSTKSAVERHHLFPKAFLGGMHITETYRVNQIANYALVEWSDNIAISDKSPSEYAPAIESKLDKQILRKMYRWHALPDGWYEMQYDDFLGRRRELMASVIHDAYLHLSAGSAMAKSAISSISVAELALQGESPNLEYKGALRTNLHTKQADPRIELSVLKTIAGFINSKAGGTLLVGVSDDGTPIGVHEDGFSNEDKMLLHLDNLIRDRLGAKHAMYIHPRFEDFEEVRVLAVECSPGSSPVFVKDGNQERFYIRMGASTFELKASETHDYIRERFA
ncbi:MAG: putative DNA binding domain-containing protein [Chloroflexota bacterium]